MRSLRLWFNSSLFLIAAKCAGLFKISFMIGSYATFFSAANSVMPLSGAFFGISGSTLIFVLSILVRVILYGGLFPLVCLVHIVPGLCAGYYWASRSIGIRFLLPVVCMILFLIHPIGNAAWIYAMYWLIPIVLYFINTKNIFAQALGSTFTAHAVGSVMWLYMVPMSVASWYALIPIVLIERLLFAVGMVVLHKIISWVMNSKWVLSKKRVVLPV